MAESIQHAVALGLLLKNMTDCHLMYITKLYDEDPNYVEGGRYKTALTELAGRHGIRYVLDLHGASATRAFDIDLGTQNGKTLREPAAIAIAECLKAQGIQDVRLNDTFAATHPGTVTAYVRRFLRIPCLQIEINGKYRRPVADIDRFASLVNGLVNVIECMKKDVEESDRQKRILRGKRRSSACGRYRHVRSRTRR